MAMARLRIGSRGSQLALWQANHISDLLRARGHTVEIEIIKTTGDKIPDVPHSSEPPFFKKFRKKVEKDM